MKNTNRFTCTILCIVLGTLFVSLSCKNITEAPALSDTRVEVSFFVASANGRTVLPTVDIAGYRLFGGQTGADEEQLAEFIAQVQNETLSFGPRLSLEAGTWHFTLNAYNTEGDIVLQGKVQHHTLVSGESIAVGFYLEPLMTGKGSARITILFPDYIGITKVTATGDLPEKSAVIKAGEGSWIWEQNDINAGYYFVSFALYKGTEQVSMVSELVLIGAGLTSGKIIAFSGNDLEPSLYTTAEGTTLTEKLDWLETNAQSGANYLVEVEANESIDPRLIEYTDKNDISVTLIGLGDVRNIELSSNGSIFTVGSGVTLALGNNITLRGLSGNMYSRYSLVHINGGGRLILDKGAVITGNTFQPAFGNSGGGGVYVSGGTFTMNGGEITGNEVSGNADTPSVGGGVYVSGGTFMMNGGEITGNRVSGNSSGGGVYVSGGTFMMNGGEITGNRSSSSASGSGNGGGVYVGYGGTFTMDGGAIMGNTAYSSIMLSNPSTSSVGGGVYVGGGTFTMNDGEITGNMVSSCFVGGGGIYVGSGTFTMNGGAITGNKKENFSSGIDYFCGGVYVGGGMFTMDGGAITGNTANCYNSMSSLSSLTSCGGGVYVGYGGTFTMNGGAITGNGGAIMRSNTEFNTNSSCGGGVYVDDGGTFTMNGGEIMGNTASTEVYSCGSGGGVYVGSGTFMMNGGEITGNTTSCDYYYSYPAGYPTASIGGGVYVGYGTFTKTGGIITGYADDPVNGNVVKDNSGSVQVNRGYAVYAPQKRKETTAGTTTKLFFTAIGSPFWYGSWDDDNVDIPLSSTTGWSDHYIPATASGELWYSFTVTRLSTYYIWWKDSSGTGDGGRYGNIKVSAQYDDGTAIFTDVDSAYTTPRALTASKDGTVRLKVSPNAAGDTGDFSIVMRRENVRP